jgi:hypothetical protein
VTDGNRSAADRIRQARDRERALAAHPPRIRSAAAARDHALGALAATDGLRPAVRDAVDAIGPRSPRTGAALRRLAGRVLARSGPRSA